jgi:hypothetical protein
MSVDKNGEIFHAMILLSDLLCLLKCLTSLRFPSPGHFISHGVPSSLKASFESE